MDQNESGTRINRYISERDFCSRREADKLIDEGRVTINGKVAEMGSKVGPKDFVKVDGKPLKAPAIHVYLALNKPVGIVSTTDSAEPDNIVDFVKYSKRIFPIGRLDKDSEGLILLTNDGDIVNKVLRAGNAHEKEYVVTVTTPINEGFMMGMAAGVPILDTVTKPCTVKQTGKRTFKIILTEGMNRQIRRMCEHFGYEVESLKRIRIMDIYLRDLPLGKWRHLTKEEIKSLKNAVKASVKTEEASTAEGPKPKRKPRPSARPTAPIHKAFKPRAKKNPSSSRAVAKR